MLAALRASPVAGIPAARIYADLRDAIHTRPSIVIDMADEDEPVAKFGKYERTLALTARILVDGADPFAVIDPIRIATHTRIMADAPLRALVESIDEGASSRARADMDVSIASLTTVYTARYTTTLEALT